MSKRKLYSLLLLLTVLPAVWFGAGLTVPKTELRPFSSKTEEAKSTVSKYSEVIFHVGIDWNNPSQHAVEEITLGLENGVRKISLPFPTKKLLHQMETLILPLDTKYEDIHWIFDLSLSPPTQWFDTHPDATTETDLRTMASVTSPEWIVYGKSRIDDFMNWQQEHELSTGLILTHLYRGNWYLDGYIDDSTACKKKFEMWLTKESHAELPQSGDFGPLLRKSSVHENFFLEFYNEQVINAVLELVSHTRNAHEWGGEIYLPIGFTLNETAMKYGHKYWARLLHSPITGLILPVARDNGRIRRTGLTEGMPDLVRAGQKDLLFWDQIATGIGEDGFHRSTKSPEHWARISHMLGRGMGPASIHQGTYYLSDQAGSGQYNDSRFWDEFSRKDLLDNAIDSGLETDVLLLLDEEETEISFYKAIYENFSHAGIRFRVVFFQDFLTEKVPDAQIYILLARTKLGLDEYKRLNEEILGAGRALIHYFPTVPNNIDRYDDFVGGSVTFDKFEDVENMPFSFAGEYIGENEELEWYSEKSSEVSFRSEQFDPLVKTQYEDWYSAGVRFTETGGAYVLLTQPITDPRFYLEIRALLELETVKYSSKNDMKHLVMIDKNLILLHGIGKDKVTFSFPSPTTLTNVYDQEMGWNSARTIELDIESGQTFLLVVQ